MHRNRAPAASLMDNHSARSGLTVDELEPDQIAFAAGGLGPEPRASSIRRQRFEHPFRTRRQVKSPNDRFAQG